MGPAMFSAHCKTRVTVDQIRIFPDSAVFINLGLYDVSTRVLCFVIFGTAILHNVYRPETADDAASDSDGAEGGGRAMIVNRITATTVCLQETI